MGFCSLVDNTKSLKTIVKYLSHKKEFPEENNLPATQSVDKTKIRMGIKFKKVITLVTNMKKHLTFENSATNITVMITLKTSMRATNITIPYNFC